MSIWRRQSIRVALCLLALISHLGSALAQESNEEQPPDPDTGESTVTERTLGLLPNPYERIGVKFAATYIGEILGNPTGGKRQGAVFDGRLNLAADIDFARLVGWNGLTAHANIFAIHGNGLSRSNLENFLVVSGIEALPSVRLYEAYFEQKFHHNDFSIRFGQFAADSEFLASKYTDVFTNASLGWPAITAINLPSGGPSPPLAAMGVRLFAKANEHLAVLAAVFDGDSAGPGSGDPQRRNPYGLNFRVGDPPLFISEMQFSWKGLGENQKLPGALKVGGWSHFGAFNDQRFDRDGLSLADPTSSGLARQLKGDQGLYAVFEQRLYTVPKDDNRGIGIFTRISGSPSDRNLIDFYADGGIDFIGVQEIRPNDKFGLAVGYAHVSPRAQALDFDFQQLNVAGWPTRSSEVMTTISYQYEMRSGWNLVPSAQYIVRPGGGAADPLGQTPGIKLHNAMVFGLRSVAKF